MEEQKASYQTFEDLDTYKIAREFRKAMDGVARRLPESEKFGLVSQVRRAAVSLTNNIAEGHGRFHYLDQIKFMLQARGSLEELLDDLNVCQDEDYLPSSDVSVLKEQGWRAHKILNGYVRFLRRRMPGGSSRVAEDVLEYPATEDESNEPTFTDRFNPSSLQPFNE
jgi:four helix bundle protein